MRPDEALSKPPVMGAVGRGDIPNRRVIAQATLRWIGRKPELVTAAEKG